MLELAGEIPRYAIHGDVLRAIIIWSPLASLRLLVKWDIFKYVLGTHSNLVQGSHIRRHLFHCLLCLELRYLCLETMEFLLKAFSLAFRWTTFYHYLFKL